jgi:hypothetical protein
MSDIKLSSAEGARGPHARSRDGRELPADALLRLTIEFVDGRSVTNFDPSSFRSDEPDLNEVVRDDVESQRG